LPFNLISAPQGSTPFVVFVILLENPIQRNDIENYAESARMRRRGKQLATLNKDKEIEGG
jgi:hypothetical protein